MSRALFAAALAVASASLLASCRAEAPAPPARRPPRAFGSLRGRAPAQTVVFLADALDPDGNLPWPAAGESGKERVELRLAGGKIEPPVSAAPLRATLVLVSEDDTFTDISAYYGLTESAFRHKFVLRGDRFSFELDRPGLMAFENENAPTVRQYLYVTPTPAFAVAGAEGYAIARIPAGHHRFTAWSLEKGILEGEAKIRRGETATLDFEFPK